MRHWASIKTVFYVQQGDQRGDRAKKMTNGNRLSREHTPFDPVDKSIESMSFEIEMSVRPSMRSFSTTKIGSCFIKMTRLQDHLQPLRTNFSRPLVANM